MSKGNVAEQRRRYKYKYPDRHKVYKKIYYMIKTGKLLKPLVCSYCMGGGRISAHHEDYAYPLEIIWLCESCHNKVHGRC